MAWVGLSLFLQYRSLGGGGVLFRVRMMTLQQVEVDRRRQSVDGTSTQAALWLIGSFLELLERCVLNNGYRMRRLRSLSKL